MNNELTPEEKETIKQMIGWLTKILEGKQIRWVNHETTLNSIVKFNARWYSRQKFEVVGELKIRAYTLDELLRIPFQEELQDKESGEHFFFIRVFVENDELLILVEDRGSGLVFRYNMETATKKLIYEDGRPFGIEVTE